METVLISTKANEKNCHEHLLKGDESHLEVAWFF